VRTARLFSLVLVSALLLLLAPLAAWALQPGKAFHHQVRDSWSIQDGLPQISALAITQDHDGYIWVGTQSGLARFDGVRFTTYTPESQPGLNGIYVRALYTARDGRVWIGTYKGLAVYDGTGFGTLPLTSASGLASIDVTDIAEDAQGAIWAAAADGVFRVQGNSLQRVAGAPSPAVSLLARRDELYVGGRGSIARLAGGQWTRMALPAEAASAAVNHIVESQGRVWAATAYGLYVLENGAWRAYTEVPRLQATPLDLLYADRDGNLWVGGDFGLARLRDRQLAELIPADNVGGIPGLRAAFEDREGNLWLGSQWEGLWRVWDSWTRRYSVAEGIDDRIVWSVSPDPDGKRVWVGTNNGLSLFDGERYHAIVPGTALPNPQAYNILAEPGRVWIGTRRGVVIANVGTGDAPARIESPAYLAPLAALQINGIVADTGGHWIVTSDGLFRLDGETLHRYGPAEGLLDPRVRYVQRAHDGALYVGSQSGVYQMQGARLREVGTARGLPPDSDIVSMASFSGGRMAVGTLSEEIFYYVNGRWHEVGGEQGMPRNSPFFITEHDGYLWAAGIRGISRVSMKELDDLAAGRITRTHGEMLLNERGDPMSGQQGYCCNGAGTSKGFLRGDTLWLPSRDGVVVMDTRDVVKNTTPPRAVVERVQVGDQWRPAYEVQRLSLPADARDLSFEFTVLSLQDPKSTQVQYRLVGYDRDWRQADPFNRNARYTNLPPGDYTFEVRGTNNAGVPTLEPGRLAFSIQPRFHETPLFLALLGLLLATLVYAGYRLQQHRYRTRQVELETLIQQRTEALEIANHRLEEASQTDPLTGLRNRRYMANQIPTDLAYYDRQLQQGGHQDEIMVFALVDIDHFKAVNDTYGHKAGDRVLQQFAQVLGALVRSGDYVVRWGGEEFLIVFRPMPMRNLTIIGNRIRDAVANHSFDIGTDAPLRITCSAGLSEYPLFRDHRTQLGWETMVELADQALYYVKTHGRDGWAAFRPTARTDLLTLLQELQNGPEAMMEQGRLQLMGSKGHGAGSGSTAGG